MKENVYLAADFGGGSGRIIVGWLESGKLLMEEIHRFPNHQIKLGNHLYWNFISLFEELKTGIKKAVQRGFSIKTIGIDTWGVDFGLIDIKGNLIGNPVCYRDDRTNGMTDKVFNIIDDKEHYVDTGIQAMQINTLFQLYSMKESDDVQLSVADKLLFMPDLFAYFLTGVAKNEYTIATTSELLNAKEKIWSDKLIHQLKLPSYLLTDIIFSGNTLGYIKKEIAKETGLNENVKVISVATHDTASAILAIPSQNLNKVFLSSGTWSILGVTVKDPILTEQAQKAGFTNEGGVGNIRFLQNITGLWILQQLMKQWSERGDNTKYDELLTSAQQSTLNSIIDVDHTMFSNPQHMEQAIIDYCVSTKQAIPSTPGDFTRCVVESLAERYKKGLAEIQLFLPEPITELHIIGGGSQNRLLNQLTADKCNVSVIAGPVEATAMGNLLMQAFAFGEVESLDEINKIVYNSTSIEVFSPIAQTSDNNNF